MKNKKLWFKRKSYGWGWTPASWEGWVVVAGFVVALIGWARGVDWESEFGVLWYVAGQVILVGLLIGICFWKGEKPRWQWGEGTKK